MADFHASDYFDLTNYQHAEFLKKFAHVWEALLHIKDYLSELPLGQILGDVSDKAYLVKPETIYIGKNTRVEPGAYIEGPCYIGDNCVVRHGAYIRGSIITGDHCVIGHDSEMKNSIMLDYAHAAHFAYVGDSILGNHTNLGAGTVCANLKLDGSEIVINHDGQRYATGCRKFGVILGDNAQTGCNSVTNPGTIVGKGSVCYPCTNFGGIIPPNSIIKPQMRVHISTLDHSIAKSK